MRHVASRIYTQKVIFLFFSQNKYPSYPVDKKSGIPLKKSSTGFRHLPDSRIQTSNPLDQILNGMLVLCHLKRPFGHYFWRNHKSLCYKRGRFRLGRVRRSGRRDGRFLPRWRTAIESGVGRLKASLHHFQGTR